MFHLGKKKSHEIVYINRSYKRIENDNFTKNIYIYIWQANVQELMRHRWHYELNVSVEMQLAERY